MVYRKENGVIVPYANNSGQNVAADISIIDKNGKVVSAGGTTDVQALVSKISDDTVELSSDLSNQDFAFATYGGTATTFESLPKGLWRLDSSKYSAMTDKPSSASGLCYVIKSSGSDERFVMCLHPHVPAIWVKFQYGAWSEWKRLSWT